MPLQISRSVRIISWILLISFNQLLNEICAKVQRRLKIGSFLDIDAGRTCGFVLVIRAKTAVFMAGKIETLTVSADKKTQYLSQSVK